MSHAIKMFMFSLLSCLFLPLTASAQTTCDGPATTIELTSSVDYGSFRSTQPLSQQVSESEHLQMLDNLRALTQRLHIVCGGRMQADLRFHPYLGIYSLWIDYEPSRRFFRCDRRIYPDFFFPSIVIPDPRHSDQPQGWSNILPHGSTPIESSEHALRYGVPTCDFADER